jgi:quercetin dioxygenase-like cupin family protein
MKLQKFRWSKVYESTEEELVEFLESRNLSFTHWAAEGFTEPTTHSFEQDGTIWCAEGSFTARADGQSFSMQPGDALPVPAGVTFEVAPGISGCICYETTTKSL